MKVSFVLLCLCAGVLAQNGYEQPPPPEKLTTAAPCDPVDESIPEECLETNPDTGCQVAVPGCPEPTTVAPDEGKDQPEGQEGYQKEDATEAPIDIPATDAPETAEETTEAPIDIPATDAPETAEETEAPTDALDQPEEAEPTEAPTDETQPEEPEPTEAPTGTDEGLDQPEDGAEEGTAGEEPTEAPATEEATDAPATAEEATEEPQAPPKDEAEQEQSSVDTDELPAEGEDVHEYCCWWAQEGECDSNPFWMRPRCQKSCGTVGCTVDGAGDCAVAMDTADCKWQKAELEGATGEAGEPAVVGKVPAEAFPSPTEDCANTHRLCNFWKAQGECESNGDWMNTNCAKACGQC